MVHKCNKPFVIFAILYITISLNESLVNKTCRNIIKVIALNENGDIIYVDTRGLHIKYIILNIKMNLTKSNYEKLIA
jgi:GTPase Era involved in 16S rRNA processing